jgi:hypothetical protein
MNYEDTVSVLKVKGHIWEPSQAGSSVVKAFDFIGTMRSLNEAAETKAKPKKEKEIRDKSDHVIYQELMKGWKWELTKTDDVKKAKEKALANLAKDSLYYTHMEMQDFVDNKEIKGREMQPVKKGSEKDALHQMKSVKVKNEKNNINGAENKSKSMEGQPEYIVKKNNKKPLKEEVDRSLTYDPNQIYIYKRKNDSNDNIRKLDQDEFDALINDKNVDTFIKATPKELEKRDINAKNLALLRGKEKKEEPSVSKKSDDKKKFEPKYNVSKPKGELFKYEITPKNGGSSNTVQMTDAEADKFKEKNPNYNVIKKISKDSSDKYRKTSTTYAPGIESAKKQTPSGNRPTGDITGIKKPEKTKIEPKKWYAVKVSPENKPLIVGSSNDKEKIKKIKGNDEEILVLPYLGLKKLGLAESLLESLDKENEEKIKNIEISFTIPGKETPYEKKSKIQSAKFDNKEQKLTILLSDKTEVVITKNAAGTLVPLYFTGNGNEYLNILNVGSSFGEIIDKVFPKNKKEKEPVSESLENYIRTRIRKAISEAGDDYGAYNGMIGPKPLKKKLNEYMKRYQWNWQNSSDPAERDRGQEVHGIVTKMVSKLGKDGILIYNSYAPEGFEIKTVNDLGAAGDFQVGAGPQDRNFYPDTLTARSGMFEAEKDNNSEAKMSELATDVITNKFRTPKEQQDVAGILGKYIAEKGPFNIKDKNIITAFHKLTDKNK